jgi:N-acetyltransferase 10
VNALRGLVHHGNDVAGTALHFVAQDVHTRFRTEAHHDVVARFNERFILSLASCESCLVLDDELNVLPISRHAKKLTAVSVADETAGDAVADVALTKEQVELAALKESISKTPLVRGGHKGFVHRPL